MQILSRFTALAVLSGTLAIPAAPAVASTPEALGALRDHLAALAPVGSSAVIDPATGEVVVRVAGEASATFRTAVTRNRPVRTVRSAAVRTTAMLMGGMAIDSLDRVPCTGGLLTKSADGGLFMVTAGHCITGSQNPWFGPGGGLVGTATSAYFPGDDFGLIRVSNVTPYPPTRQSMWGTGTVLVGATADVAVGTSVCKTGRTTGLTCGTVLAKNATWHYHQGVVSGLIETDLCVGAGDSGSALLSTRGGYGSRSQNGAFGILSGSNGLACATPGFRSAFQPLPEVMSFYGLTVFTG
jgi:hypothetical protein